MPLIIRRAERDDLDVLVRFAQTMARETEDKSLDAGTVRAGVRAVLGPQRDAFYLMAETEDGETAGALMVTSEWSDWRAGVFWWIQSVYVHPAFRRQGIYRKLYAHVRQQAADATDVCGLRLYVEKENAAARAAYDALGMTETSYRMYETAV